MMVTGPIMAWLWIRGVAFLMRIDPELGGRGKARWRHFFWAGHRRLLPTARQLIGTTFNTLGRFTTHQRSSPPARPSPTSPPHPRPSPRRPDMDTEWATPPDLRGRQRADRMFRALGGLITFYDWLTAAFAHRPPTRGSTAT